MKMARAVAGDDARRRKHAAVGSHLHRWPRVQLPLCLLQQRRHHFPMLPMHLLLCTRELLKKKNIVLHIARLNLSHALLRYWSYMNAIILFPENQHNSDYWKVTVITEKNS
ncbi:hypothetical protein U9M48_038989 [Paspalum notatum var. saurae]|uniref:Uncharacterized protein n=1 Tax=Paspalum notatum var. saurae TaxID=547442 RepID=A0AAQ3UJQ3_PASNO